MLRDTSQRIYLSKGATVGKARERYIYIYVYIYVYIYTHTYSACARVSSHVVVRTYAHTHASIYKYI